MTEIDYEARVAKGIALLDERYPDWAANVDPDALQLSSHDHCVTAQLAQRRMDDSDASYRDGMDMLGLAEDSFGTGSYTQHGFNAESLRAPGMPENYRQIDAYHTLDNIWRREIIARRSGV